MFFLSEAATMGPPVIENCDSLVPYFDELVVSFSIFIYIYLSDPLV